MSPSIRNRICSSPGPAADPDADAEAADGLAGTLEDERPEVIGR